MEAFTFSRKTLFFLQVTAFLSAIGYGIVLPVLPFFTARFVSDPGQIAAVIGWLMSTYALCSFLAGPTLGALSDRFGRRPVLLLSLLGSAVGYLVFGLAGLLWMLFLGRIIDGLTAGSIGALFGYLADITPPQERGKYFGLIGATFGAGFIVGPAVGGVLARMGLEAPFLIAAGVALLNMLWGYFFLPESLKPEHRTREFHLGQLNPFAQIGGLFRMPQIRPLLAVGGLFWAAFVVVQTTMALLLKDTLGWDATHTSFIFTLVGLVDILVQGVILGWLSRRLGDYRTATFGLVVHLIGLAGLALLVPFPSVPLLLVASVLTAGGEGLFTATLGGLLSQRAGSAQGQVQGGSQALQSLTNMAVPPLVSRLYGGVGPSAPYWAAVGVVAFSGVLLNLSSHSNPEPLES
jgi:DHA1 family tetracycline resistance protein-like MFS transporter